MNPDYLIDRKLLLCVNKDCTSLRYLLTTHNFLYYPIYLI